MGNLFSKKKKATINKEKPAEPAVEPTVEPTVEPAVAPAVEPKTVPPTGDFAQDLLKAQNEYRSRHGVPEMKISEKLNQDAQKWADEIAKNDKLEHSEDRDGAGENLGWGSGSLGAQETATMWYDEIKDYDFSKPGFASNTGHFTQVVWKASTEFGGAFATSASGATFVVGRYLPAGNVNAEGQFEENVLAAK